MPTPASHPFYRRLNQLLREHRFDDFVEAQCAGFYAETMGRPGLPPGIYFRLLLIGYFEGIDAERGSAWRAADEGDTGTIQETLPEAAEQLDAVAAVTEDTVAVIEEVVADKGYHSRTTVHDLETLAIRTYISEPMRTLFGVGTPRSLQGSAVALGAMITVWCTLIDDVIAAIWLPRHHTPSNMGFRLAESVA